MAPLSSGGVLSVVVGDEASEEAGGVSLGVEEVVTGAEDSVEVSDATLLDDVTLPESEEGGAGGVGAGGVELSPDDETE